MAVPLKTLATALGKLKKDLIEEGYNDEQAFTIVIDLVRRGDVSPEVLSADTSAAAAG